VSALKFIFDLDSTIVFGGQPISDGIRGALLELTACGHEILFASARPVRDMLPVIPESLHHCTMIGGNGTLIGKDGQVAAPRLFPDELLKELFRLIEARRTPYLLDGVWDYVYTGPDDHPILRNLDIARLARNVSLNELDPVVKVLLLPDAPDDADLWMEVLSRYDVSIIRHHSELIIDICPGGISKWSALQFLGVEERSFVAFGNDANDQAMLQHARYAVRVGEYEPLAACAHETICLGEGCEERIAGRIIALAQQFRQG
jgi:hypothetical protein